MTPGEPEGEVRPELLLFDVLGRRWTMRVLWELRGGALAFNEIRRRCAQMSTSVLSRRLAELREVGLAAHDEFGSWELTGTGQNLCAVLVQLADLAPGLFPGE